MTDFSMIPSYFIDDASLLHGTSSVNETGGGLGGAVKLATRPADRRGLRTAVRPGRRVVLDLRRVPAPDLRRRPLAEFDARGLFLVAERFQVQKLQQETERLRRRSQYRRFLLSRRTQQERRLPRSAPVAGTLLQFAATATVSDCRRGTSIRRAASRCCRSTTRRTTTTPTCSASRRCDAASCSGIISARIGRWEPRRGISIRGWPTNSEKSLGNGNMAQMIRSRSRIDTFFGQVEGRTTPSATSGSLRPTFRCTSIWSKASTRTSCR